MSDAKKSLEETDIETSDLFRIIKTNDETTVRKSKTYYAMYGEDGSVENLAWSSDRILNTCKEPPRDKIREELVSVSALEVGGLLVLKKILDINMDVDNCAVRALTQNVQVLPMKGVPGETVETVVSFLKGALMLIRNCATLPTDTIGLINNPFVPPTAMNLEYSCSWCIDHKRGSRPITPAEHL